MNKNKELNIDMQIKAIELLNSSLILPANPTIPINNFNFNISLENRANATDKLVFIIVHVKIKNEDQSIVLGGLSVSCIFEIANFEKNVTIEPEGKIKLPKQLVEILNSISISTTRGVMFSTFKGTFLHGAVLPIIDPKQFQENK